MTKLEELEALARAATQGTYEVVRFDNDDGSINYQVETEIRQDERHGVLASFTEYGNPKRNKADAAYYAAMNPAQALKLIEVIRVQREALDQISHGAGYVDAHTYSTWNRSHMMSCAFDAEKRVKEILDPSRTREVMGDG